MPDALARSLSFGRLQHLVQAIALFGLTGLLAPLAADMARSLMRFAAPYLGRS
ncbi:hypothetical protein KFK14_16685 [Sphingobium phenoxybenzoativorans]|uniref:Uncharacterized protein n=1 Tax=Sphingobium phenoxybenzoativorans TaxID=1592790 RepID=A0A975Q0R3_9SPHN|nr:hypothetical protein [Sphingobium phenoxybenzoativorans]QUT04663.1 hypothetical protein KFK14_16685 [Sphingobium phenoxybenzoativorans]